MQQAVAMTDAMRDDFNVLLEAHRAIAFKVAGTYCRHPDDRDDLVQEIAAQLWRAWPGYDSARPFATFMYRIALNVAIDYVRNESRRRQHATPLDEELHDMADMAIEDLRRWKWWDLTRHILAQYGKPTHAAPLVKNAILRYALTCPDADSAAFVKALRVSEPALVREVEESLEFERPTPPKKP